MKTLKEYVRINEMLKSHKIDVILKQLENEFGENKVELIDKYKDADLTVAEIKLNVIKTPKNKQRLLNILHKFNWRLCVDKGDVYTIEPDMSNEVTDFIYNDCDGILYHVSDIKYLDSILKVGLRIDHNKIKDHIGKRIYLCSGKTEKDVKDSIEGVIESKIEGGDINNRHNCCVVKIDLNKHNNSQLSFYEATGMDYDGVYVYTYHEIPNKMITDVTNEFI